MLVQLSMNWKIIGNGCLAQTNGSNPIVEEPEAIAKIGVKVDAQATLGIKMEAVVVTDQVEVAIVMDQVQIKEPSKLKENEKS